MIHIVTIHWKDDRWVDVQLNYLKKNITKPFKVYAFLNSLSGNHQSKFFYSSTEDIKSHPIKLNLLADMAILNSTEDKDWLMFLDGDAFPIGDIVTFGNDKLGKYPLIAIQRKENLGDIQPHPSFCLTTIKFWRDIEGDWKAGCNWQNLFGYPVSDVGGNLLSILNDRGIDWYPMIRSNRNNLHPLLFGIYENLIYHQGAGFRRPLSRIDEYNLNIFFRLLRKLPDVIRKRIPIGDIVCRENKILSEKVYKFILKDPDFYKYFLSPD